MSVTNNASWLAECGGDFVVRQSTYTKPGPDEVVIKNGAVAVNPSSFPSAPWIRMSSNE